jgi:osmotically-inducible protein OsmY
VIHQLDWDPEVDASAIGVAAQDGAVTLTGFIGSYAGKLAAERVTKLVRGVRAVANDIVVRLAVERTDADLAHDVVQALRLIPAIAEHVQAAVHNGHVTLTGTVEWLCQKAQAETAIRLVRGLRGVFNHIDVVPKTTPRDIQRRIVRTLHDNATIDASRISAAVAGDTVVLRGTVTSWLQRDAVERAAGSASGIRHVDNHLEVVPVEPYEFEPPDRLGLP